jgi:hypothetical protein
MKTKKEASPKGGLKSNLLYDAKKNPLKKGQTILITIETPSKATRKPNRQSS